jgi:hypothetical protein
MDQQRSALDEVSFIGLPRGGNKDCTTVTVAPVLPVGKRCYREANC